MSVLKYAALTLALGFANFASAQVTQQTQRDAAATGQNRSSSADASRTGQASSQAQTGQVGQAGRLGASSQGTDMDSFIATCLLLGNQEEVALAQLAVERAESDQVKQFAQMLINDHQKTIQKLQPMAKHGIGLSGATQTASSSQSSGVRSAQQSDSLQAGSEQLGSQQPGSQRSASQQPGAQQYTANRPNLDRNAGGSVTADQILQLDQQATQHCLQMTKSMLEEKQGKDFDKAFAGMQVGAHVGMLAKLKAAEQHASGELASLIQQSQQTVQSHLEQAKQICEQLESGSQVSQARTQ